MIPIKKRCGACKKIKYAKHFHKHAASADGLQWACKPCRDVYQKRHLAKHSQRNFEAYLRVKQEAFERYGGMFCKHCGINDMDVLTIDHVANNGAAHRRDNGYYGGQGIYAWLRQQEYPAGYQVLCMNCNWKKFQLFRRSGGNKHGILTLKPED